MTDLQGLSSNIVLIGFVLISACCLYLLYSNFKKARELDELHEKMDHLKTIFFNQQKQTDITNNQLLQMIQNTGIGANSMQNQLIPQQVDSISSNQTIHTNPINSLTKENLKKLNENKTASTESRSNDIVNDIVNNLVLNDLDTSELDNNNQNTESNVLIHVNDFNTNTKKLFATANNSDLKELDDLEDLNDLEDLDTALDTTEDNTEQKEISNTKTGEIFETVVESYSNLDDVLDEMDSKLTDNVKIFVVGGDAIHASNSFNIEIGELDEEDMNEFADDGNNDNDNDGMQDLNDDTVSIKTDPISNDLNDLDNLNLDIDLDDINEQFTNDSIEDMDDMDDVDDVNEDDLQIDLDDLTDLTDLNASVQTQEDITKVININSNITLVDSIINSNTNDTSKMSKGDKGGKGDKGSSKVNKNEHNIKNITLDDLTFDFDQAPTIVKLDSTQSANTTVSTELENESAIPLDQLLNGKPTYTNTSANTSANTTANTNTSANTKHIHSATDTLPEGEITREILVKCSLKQLKELAKQNKLKPVGSKQELITSLSNILFAS
jgi:hypothetical protein